MSGIIGERVWTLSTAATSASRAGTRSPAAARWATGPLRDQVPIRSTRCTDLLRASTVSQAAHTHRSCSDDRATTTLPAGPRQAERTDSTQRARTDGWKVAVGRGRGDREDGEMMYFVVAVVDVIVTHTECLLIKCVAPSVWEWVRDLKHKKQSVYAKALITQTYWCGLRVA